MLRRIFYAAIPLAVLLAVPIALKPRTSTLSVHADMEKLVIITPHNEPVRAEFARAFEEYYQTRFQRNISVEYRTVGGTSDIVRYIRDRFRAEFRQEWENSGKCWSADIASGFCMPGRIPASEAGEARKRFMASDIGIGIDLFWGGGVYEQSKMAGEGYAVDAGTALRHPEYFRKEVIPEHFAGDVFYDRKGRFYGVCLASFGICYNPQRIAAMVPDTVPDTWRSLGEPRFFNTLVLADPTKSGSANKCFEVILQQCMLEAVTRLKNEQSGLNAGWIDGFSLIKRIVANARMISDGASLVPREISSGNAAAGMAIDTFGLSEQQWSEETQKFPSIRYIPPRGGTSVSADPIQMLRGAPNRRAAKAFIDYLLSIDGQKLWEYRVGLPDGPEKYALRRPPIRRDLYAKPFTDHFSDPDYNPYRSGADFVYHAQWTGKAFNLIRLLVKCTALDPRQELQLAWKAILQAGGPDKVPEAMREFNAFPVPYPEIGRAIAELRPSGSNPMLHGIRLQRTWSEDAIRHYRRAAELARQGK